MTTTTKAKSNYFAVKAIIAKRQALKALEAGSPAPVTAPRRARTSKAATAASRRPVPVAAPVAPANVEQAAARAIEGTLSDIARVKGKKGYFTRAQFTIKDGDDYTSVTALISDVTKKALGDNLKDGFIKLYGSLQNDTFRVIGIGYSKRARTPLLKSRVVDDYSYQHEAVFGAVA